MKKIILTTLLISVISFVNAQKTDVIESTEVVENPEVSEDGTLYSTKVKVITRKAQKNKFDPKQKHQLNQDRVASPVSVDKIIMIDNDMDPFYDKTTIIKYYKYKGRKYNFQVEKNNLLISYSTNSNTVNSAKAYKSRNNRFYIVTGNDFNGVGYFNSNNDFVLEYYDKLKGDTEYAIFESFKM
ncbi:hypothetical protein EV195_101576 [Tenacibaculum skagerrakense]|uniref:Uncharacterized protein n=1 Tax=Tenacibaculum skagerrakense TaxID=186571 RepID=A0A4R2P183_9FLAO|nr:hypothetical protein [Tenacibaculum skagerrakense]TCP28400.1 hypothetical protein EV195_101576 [Tenacibaculum skagerrakense]